MAPGVVLAHRLFQPAVDAKIRLRKPSRWTRRSRPIGGSMPRSSGIQEAGYKTVGLLTPMPDELFIGAGNRTNIWPD